MNDVLVEVYSEATLKSYEFWIPKSALIQDVIRKMMEEIAIFESNDALFDSDVAASVVLVSSRTGEVLSFDFTVLESGILSGDKLVLV